MAEGSKVCCNLRAMVLSMNYNVGDDLMQRCLKSLQDDAGDLLSW